MLPPIITFKPKAVRRRTLVRNFDTATTGGKRPSSAARIRGRRISLKASSMLGKAKLQVLKPCSEAVAC